MRLAGMAMVVVVPGGIAGATRPWEREGASRTKEDEGRKGEGGVDPQMIHDERLLSIKDRMWFDWS